MSEVRLLDFLAGNPTEAAKRNLFRALAEGFSQEARDRRGQAAADFGRSLERYIPPNLRPLAGFLTESNPVMGIYRAGDASARVFAPNRTGMERVGDLGEALSETAAVVVPMGALAKVGRPAAEAMQEGLLGMSVPARSAAQAVIDRLNQPGPVPTMYSNPLMGGGMSDPTPPLPSPRNEAEAMAKQVLEMRAAGNAGDVTEEMMAAADDQYMYFNTPLPMDEASRMARGQDYDPNYFHGTGSDIVGVDPSKLGEKQNVLGEGFYTTTSTKRSDRYVPKVTDEYGDRVYAEGGNVMPLATKGAGEFDLTAQTGKENITRIANAFKGSDFDVDLRDGGDSAFIKSKTNPDISVYIDSYAEGQNTLARLKDAFGNANLTPIFKEAGFTGLKGLEGAGSNVRVSYNPENVRSRFARFDPEFRHLRNLSAGIGGLGLMSQLQGREEQY